MVFEVQRNDLGEAKVVPHRCKLIGCLGCDVNTGRKASVFHYPTDLMFKPTKYRRKPKKLRAQA